MIPQSLLLLLLHAPPQFTRVEEKDGVLVEARPVAGSNLVELRLTASTRKSPDSLCEVAFGTGKLDPEEPDLKSRQVLFESADERVTYDQVAPPVVKARDYAARVKRVRSGSDCKVIFEAANDVAPQKPEGLVRISKLRGEWKFERVGDGKTQLTYVVFTDPGGSIPTAWVEGSRRKFALRAVMRVLGRARD